jgi:hypothetical protein
MPITGVGGAVPDELLRGTGNTTSAYQALTTGTTAGTGVFIGEGQAPAYRLAVSAATGGATDWTADVKFQDSASATTGYTDMGVAFPQVTNLNGRSFNAIGSANALARQVVHTRVGRPYVRPFITLGGSAPAITLAVIAEPTVAPA